MPTEAELAEARGESARLKEQLAGCETAQKAAEARAERAEKELQDFVYATSHDLQEPLRAVSAYAQLLQRKYSADPESSELAGFIVEGAKRVTSLVQALLAYSRAGNSPRRNTVNLNVVVEAALYKLNARIRESGAKVVHGDLPDVLVDQTQLTQVMEQLLGNAIQYRAAEAPVVEIGSEEGDDGYKISVRDNGPGIEPRFHEQIFLPFKRLHGKEMAGAGLGLAVCRKIIAAHGGSIWVESDGEHGSTFQFTIPF